jgi:hypothetical protein
LRLRPGAEARASFVDGCPATDLAGVGLPIADPPVRAPLLRHVLSTEPKQRVGYFKVLEQCST